MMDEYLETKYWPLAHAIKAEGEFIWREDECTLDIFPPWKTFVLEESMFYIKSPFTFKYLNCASK